ncbi:MAG: hypothetical protein FK731_12240, partial [Asgard group archaeon]|nr:hypothetical protein [Asgard group archaeon]
MQKVDRKIVPREYQKLILDLIQFHISNYKSVLLELDCGMGKRVITYELLTSLFPNKRIILVVLSSSSLHETRDFLQNEYGGVEGFNWIGPGISNSYAQKILQSSRVILCTPQKLANILKKSPIGTADSFDFLIINEVDKLIRRVGSKRVLVFPWSELLTTFNKSKIIGMSGTLRDSHFILDQDQMEIRKELDTLVQFIPEVEIIYMDYLAGTDITKFTNDTIIETVPVDDPFISQLSDIITEQLKEAYNEIKKELQEESPSYLAKVKELGPQALLQAPVSESIRSKASSLTLLRKYLFAMVPSQIKKFLWKVPGVDPSMLPVTPQKILKSVEIAQNSNKIVILCSYIKTAKAIYTQLNRAKIKPFLLTGQVFDKNSVLNDFRNYKGKAAVIMSPIGERDIDLPEADKLIIFDCVRTT